MVCKAYNQVNTTFVASTIDVTHKSLVLGVAVDCGASAFSGSLAIHVILRMLYVCLKWLCVCTHSTPVEGVDELLSHT